MITKETILNLVKVLGSKKGFGSKSKYAYTLGIAQGILLIKEDILEYLNSRPDDDKITEEYIKLFMGGDGRHEKWTPEHRLDRSIFEQGACVQYHIFYKELLETGKLK